MARSRFSSRGALDEGRAQDRHADGRPLHLQLVVQAFGKRDDAVLRGAVRGARRHGKEPGGGRRVHDMRGPALPDHPGHEGLDAVDDAHQVDADEPLPVFRRSLPDPAAGSYARVVEEQRDVLRFAVRELREPGNLVGP